MGENEVLITSIENVRSMVHNSILMLREADMILSEERFEPIYGNTIGSEPSKSIQQNKNTFSNFFPQYMSRAYIHHDKFKQKKETRVLIINIQFYHARVKLLTPCVLGGVLDFGDIITDDQKKDIQHWWLKCMAFENKNLNFKADGNVYKRENFKEKVKLTTFWGIELIKITDVEMLREEVINKLLEEYEK
ncbi:hypothetical protein [Evansella tamaricis]|uniref:Uncharacterized protein n=1 Tax=Evansella tamaricis TaxID=2069301 RepID=A0ABS6JD49_9BACI|nr:hypothetical protein [Evansella tamaricis]MBU9711604.1 hypothetical protein [Evansella tamaricis]